MEGAAATLNIIIRMPAKNAVAAPRRTMVAAPSPAAGVRVLSAAHQASAVSANAQESLECMSFNLPPALGTWRTYI